MRFGLVATMLLGACTAVEPELELAQTESALVDPSTFVLPQLSAAERGAIVARYAAIDPLDRVPRGLLEDALVYYDVNQARIPNGRYLVVVDLSRYSGQNRFWLVDMATGDVAPHKVAHGAGSDPDNDGRATLFGNVPNSNKSSLGFFLTGEIYDGAHPHSMRIDGLSVDGSPNGMANTNVRDRAVVVHEAAYVSDANTSQQGRSDGCFALDPSIERGVVDKIHGGALIYAAKAPLAAPIGRAPCGVITDTTTIDDGDACFSTGGPATGLHVATGAGAGGHLVWTHATASAAEQDFAEWSLAFAAAGRYRVEVYTDAAYAQAKHASYRVRAGGVDHVAQLDQSAADGFQTLGDFDFAAGGDQLVHLGDNTGDTGAQLAFDAVRITPLDGRSGKADAASPSTADDGPLIGGCSTSPTAPLGIGLALLGLRRRKRVHSGR